MNQTANNIISRINPDGSVTKFVKNPDGSVTKFVKKKYLRSLN